LPWMGTPMTSLRFAILATAASVVIYTANFKSLTQAAVPTTSAQTAPDNTARNKDQNADAETQSNMKADRLSTAKIRRALIADKELSTYAHNVKIITVNGTVTLKGPVKSEEEKQKVASDAATVVSAENIVDKMTVKQ
jgi:hyperosmotically inducible periplasmic protein